MPVVLFWAPCPKPPMSGNYVKLLSYKVLSRFHQHNISAIFCVLVMCSIVEHGEENCKTHIEAHRECMKKMGFSVWRNLILLFLWHEKSIHMCEHLKCDDFWQYAYMIIELWVRAAKWAELRMQSRILLEMKPKNISAEPRKFALWNSQIFTYFVQQPSHLSTASALCLKIVNFFPSNNIATCCCSAAIVTMYKLHWISISLITMPIQHVLPVTGLQRPQVTHQLQCTISVAPICIWQITSVFHFSHRLQWQFSSSCCHYY